MKNFRQFILLSLGSFAVLMGLLFGLSELGVEAPHIRAKLVEAQKECNNRGGTWIANPAGIVQHRMFGEGCNLDYAARLKR